MLGYRFLRVGGRLPLPPKGECHMKPLRYESGQDLVEYALIVGAVALALLASVGTMTEVFRNVVSDLTAMIGTIGATK